MLYHHPRNAKSEFQERYRGTIEVPDRYLREPWKMPREVQDEVGCVIGSDYPGPMVDHPEARREALERYRA